MFYCIFVGNYINVRNYIFLIIIWVLWGDNYRFGCGMIKFIINNYFINDNDFIFFKYRCSNGFCDLCIFIIFFLDWV